MPILDLNHKSIEIRNIAKISENFNLLEKMMTFFDDCKSPLLSESLASLNNPVLRNRPFSLMELARNKICSPGITYEEISKLEIPKVLQEYLQEIWVKIICK